MPEKRCTDCGESMEAHWTKCPLCGLDMSGTSSPSGSGKAKGVPLLKLDDAPPAPASAARPMPAAPPSEEDAPAEPEDRPPEAPAAAATSADDDEEPDEGTMRMSIGDATKAWLEDSGEDGATPTAAKPRGNLKPLIVVLVIAAVALGVLLVVLS